MDTSVTNINIAFVIIFSPDKQLFNDCILLYIVLIISDLHYLYLIYFNIERGYMLLCYR